MENNDRKKYLKRLKIQNTILVVIMIIAATILIYRVSDYVQDINFEKSKYYNYRFKSTYPPHSEIQALISAFTAYEGKQTGSQVKALIQKLIRNANTFREDASRIPKIEYIGSNGEVIYSDNRIESVSYEEINEEIEDNSFKKIFSKYDYDELERRFKMEKEAEEKDEIISTEFLENDGYNSYLKVLSNISTKIKSKHTYEVELKYKWDQVVSAIIINE